MLWAKMSLQWTAMKESSPGGWIEENTPGHFFNQLAAVKSCVARATYLDALAERSGDSAFDETTPVVVLFPKRRRVSLAAAVQNVYRPITF